MSKPILIILLCVAYVTSACGNSDVAQTGTPLTTPQIARADPSSPAPKPDPSPSASPTAKPVEGGEQLVDAPVGLYVVYLRDGNLWAWTEADNSVLLTDTGDLSAIQLSGVGRLLAFMRGRDVWTVHIDGTGARLLVIQKEIGGALRFSPDGSILAVSTADHIDLIDLVDETAETVLTYSVIPNGYYPEIVWSADSSGFKTIVPSDSENGEAEFLFVFPSGTTASLAKFSTVSLHESHPFISPDGGYVIFVANTGDGKNSLFLMDSSGASKPYGEPEDGIRVYGWLPDSKYFVYAQDKQGQLFLGSVTGEPPIVILEGSYETMRWLDAERFLAMQDGDLYLGNISGERLLIANDVSAFDFEMQ